MLLFNYIFLRKPYVPIQTGKTGICKADALAEANFNYCGSKLDISLPISLF